MAKRFHALFVAALLATLPAASALAQAPNAQGPNTQAPSAQAPNVQAPDGTEPKVDPTPEPKIAPPEPKIGPNPEPKLVEPPANLPRPQTGDSKINIDKLFEALKIAPTEESAKYVENRIWALWLAAGGDTSNLLMGRVKTAMEKKELDLALKLLNAIIDLKPEFVEAWNRRATVFFNNKDYVSAIADIREVLVREPRHFGALSGLGTIMQELGDDKAALEAYRRALAVHPKLDKIPEMVKKLTEKVEGREI
jgi:tetratricopeptide (TPR) repeat protein